MHQIAERPAPPAFKLDIVRPFASFEGGAPKRTPFVVDGLLPEAAFSILAGKPKHGKSSLARFEAVALAKGQQFLGRQTIRGETLLITLEDPVPHVDNALRALGYDPATDAPIHLVTKLAPGIDDSIAAIEEVLVGNPDIRLVIVDTLAKLLRVSDMNDYGAVMPQVEKVHNLARKFPRLHVQGLAHAKKAKSDDVFDSLLGSTALRGEPDTTIALYDHGGHRVIATETRIGRSIPPTILHAEMIESAGTDVVKSFSLAEPLSERSASLEEKGERKQRASHAARVIEYLESCDGCVAPQETVLREVAGRRLTVLDAVKMLADAKVLTVTGIKHSPVDPLTLRLNPDAKSRYQFMNRFGGITQ
jgi:hypothetical protein